MRSDGASARSMSRPLRTPGTCVDLTDDRGTATAGIVDPSPLGGGRLGRAQIHALAARILDLAALEGEPVTGGVGRNYGSTQIASVHSLAAKLKAFTRGLMPREEA